MEQPKKSLVDALNRTISKEQLVEISNRMAEDCHREFNNFCKREKNELVDVSVEMKSVFLSEGISHEEIIAQAKQKNADLIVMGKNNNYSNNYGQKLIGNTTLGVLLGSDIPILCI
jgi:nucleotide-binding universal stress UspA family protein